MEGCLVRIINEVQSSVCVRVRVCVRVWVIVPSMQVYTRITVKSVQEITKKLNETDRQTVLKMATIRQPNGTLNKCTETEARFLFPL